VFKHAHTKERGRRPREKRGKKRGQVLYILPKKGNEEEKYAFALSRGKNGGSTGGIKQLRGPWSGSGGRTRGREKRKEKTS